MSDKKRIKTEIRKQLKASIPTWNRLSKQTKKELCQSIMKKVTLQYYQGTLPSSEHYEQLQLHPIPAGVMSLTDMKDFVSYMSKKLFTFPCPDKNWYLSAELRAIDQLLDDRILNALLSPPQYTPSKREKTPAMLFRTELLKSLNYAEMSYRKFCKLEINDLERKRNRTFIGLNRRRAQKIHHTELSLFRSTLTWKQQVNLLVYFALHFFDSSLGAGSFYYGLDSTDLAAKMNTHPLATVTLRINGKEKNISVYSHLDTECGERRKKSDRSSFYVGGIAEIPAFFDGFYLQPELLLSLQGADIGFENLNLYYLHIPLMGKYHITDEIAVEFGPQIGFLVADNWDDPITGSDTNKINFGINIGGGYRLNENFYFQLRYNSGFTKILDGTNLKNRVLQIGAAYFF